LWRSATSLAALSTFKLSTFVHTHRSVVPVIGKPGMRC
jgi:hypothetical protein